MDRAEIEKFIAERARAERKIARAFVLAAYLGDVKAFASAAGRLDDETVDGWRYAINGIGRLTSVSAAIQSEFLAIWVENKSISIHIDNRRALVKALRVFFPCDYQGPALHLYRGTMRGERRRRCYRFSWTTKLEVARHFADRYTQAIKEAAERGCGNINGNECEGIILETVAPSGAIMLIRDDKNYYDEDEVVVDPFALQKIGVL